MAVMPGGMGMAEMLVRLRDKEKPKPTTTVDDALDTLEETLTPDASTDDIAEEDTLEEDMAPQPEPMPFIDEPEIEMEEVEFDETDPQLTPKQKEAILRELQRKFAKYAEDIERVDSPTADEARRRLQEILHLHGNGLFFDESQLSVIEAIDKVTNGGDPTLINKPNFRNAIQGGIGYINRAGNPWGNSWGAALWIDHGDHLGAHCGPLEFFEYMRDLAMEVAKDDFWKGVDEVKDYHNLKERNQDDSTRMKGKRPPTLRPTSQEDKDGDGIPDAMEGPYGGGGSDDDNV